MLCLDVFSMTTIFLGVDLNITMRGEDACNLTVVCEDSRAHVQTPFLFVARTHCLCQKIYFVFHHIMVKKERQKTNKQSRNGVEEMKVMRFFINTILPLKKSSRCSR